MNVSKVDMQNSLALQAILHVFDTERRVKLLKKKKNQVTFRQLSQLMPTTFRCVGVDSENTSLTNCGFLENTEVYMDTFVKFKAHVALWHYYAAHSVHRVGQYHQSCGTAQ